MSAPLIKGRVERRLAAILTADVAGYSRLMGADEVGTPAALKSIRGEVVDPSILLSPRTRGASLRLLATDCDD
jgi:class 3 adenylate cyclase